MMTLECPTADSIRAARLVLAWLTNDKPAADLAISELTNSDESIAGTLFAAVDLAAHAVALADPDGCVEHLRESVARLALAEEGESQ